MTKPALHFFTPPAYPEDEAARQAVVDSFRFADAARDPRLAAIVAHAADLFGAPSAAISIVDRDRQNWIVRTGLEPDGTARALSFCGHAVAQPDQVFTVRDARADKRFAGNPLVNGAMAQVRFYAGAPLLHEGTALGALCVIDPGVQPHLGEAKRAELSRLAAEAVAILETYR